MSDLPVETREAYAKIVDGILATVDLDSVSSKQIRLKLQSVVGKDLTEQKAAINQLIVTRFDKAAESQNNGNETPRDTSIASTTASTPTVNTGVFSAKGTSQSRSPVSTKREASSDTSDVIDDAPPKKKPKTPAVETDAALAARLQAEEDRRSRATRGGGARPKRPVAKSRTPKKSKKKSASKVSANDDSDLDSGSDDDKPVKRNGAFHKPMNLSEPLSQLLGGETQLSRPQTVKKIWEYVRENDLQNPEDKRQIRCDEAMRAVFKQDSVHMFSMNKILSKHLYPVGGDE